MTAQPDFSFADLEGRLEDHDRALLAEAVFADNSGEELFTPEQAVSYLECARDGRRSKQVSRSCRHACETHRRSGDLQTAIALAEQIDTLKKAIRQ